MSSSVMVDQIFRNAVVSGQMTRRGSRSRKWKGQNWKGSCRRQERKNSVALEHSLKTRVGYIGLKSFISLKSLKQARF